MKADFSKTQGPTMTDKGQYNESEMMQRTCKFVRVMRADTLGASVNRNAPHGRLLTTDELGMADNWDKCEGSKCAHWRWHRQFPWSKVTHGGLGYCGLSGKP